MVILSCISYCDFIKNVLYKLFPVVYELIAREYIENGKMKK